VSEQGRPPTEDELRAAYEAEMKKVRVEDVVVQTIVSLINLGGRKAGLAPGAEDEKDLDQLREAIEAVRALMPLAESSLGPDAPQVREALSQLQLAYAQERQGAPAAAATPQGGTPAAEAPATEEKPGDGPGPAQQSGRLWVPGQ
jgi:hypothetical protein